MFNNAALLGSKWNLVAVWLVRYFVCASSFVLLMKAGMYLWNAPSKIHRHLAANSYRIYLLHMSVVVLVQLAFYRWTSLDWVTTLIGTMVLSLLGSYVVSVAAGAAGQWLQRGIGKESRPEPVRLAPDSAD
jgi:peptidoglycan/LPS O-acetylase OafA/YrhL